MTVPDGPIGDPAFAPLRDAPATAGLCCDFDGTLAAIVDDPAAARPMPGATEALVALSGRLGALWVVSGRPVAFLAAHLPAEVGLSGLYGLESRVDGAAAVDPRAATWVAMLESVAAEAEAEAASGHGVLVERKGLAVTLHFRVHPGAADEARTLADRLAGSSGLVVHPGRMSFELRPPIEVDKGTVVEAAIGGLDSACFIGDDRGDLPAFDALDRLARRGLTAIRVAVDSAEAPAELLERADVVLAGPAQVVELLGRLGGLVAG